MKKFFSIVLSAVMLLSFAACKNNDNSSKSNTVDLEYYAGLGQLPECNYKLGDSIETLKSELSAANDQAGENGEDYVYSVTEGEKTLRIDNGSFVYYYDKEKESNGISYIISLDTAYGFESGTSILEIKEALPELEPTEEEANSDNVFFIYGVSNGTVLKYNFENRVVMFVFADNMLCATALYDTDNWNE